MTKSPRAVLISDIHYRLNTLELADTSLRMAVEKASELGVQLIICGDLTDGKSIIRGEVANTLIRTLDWAHKVMGVGVRILVGNHDLLNEKGTAHALEFLDPWACVIDTPLYVETSGKDIPLFCIPYQNDSNKVLEALKDVDEEVIVLMHQGVKGAFMGDYIVDKSSIDPTLLTSWRCISGHYHKAQNVGDKFSYIGSPYSITFTEANDGPKGFQVLYNDGSLEQVPTNLRKHVIVERTVNNVMEALAHFKIGDLLWLKVTGPQLELDKIKKGVLGAELVGQNSFKLDLIPTDSEVVHMDQSQGKTDSEILDALIDASNESDLAKAQLRSLYRWVLS